MQIKYSKTALKFIEKLDSTTKQRIKYGIENLPGGDINKLTGYSIAYRLRVGDWRILFNMVNEEIEAHAKGLEEYNRGEYVRHEDIDWS